MTSAETSYILNTRIGSGLPIVGTDNNIKTVREQKVPTTKYLDIDSTYRDRFNYPNPCNFVCQINYPNRSNDPVGSINPVSDSLYYHGIPDPFQDIPLPTYQYITSAASITNTQIPLDVHEPIIYDFYINNYLQIAGEFRKILSYDGATKVAVIESAFTMGAVPISTPYLIRRSLPLFMGTVGAVISNLQFTLNALASTIDGFYTNSYIEFGAGSVNMLEGLAIRIVDYVGATRTVTLASQFPFAVNIGDSIDINGFSRDSTSSLLFAGNPDTSIVSYYEVELLWLSMPIQILDTGYGGYLNNYPYVYVSLYNEGNQLSKQVFYSNNPNSTQVIFKVPIDQYFGDTMFYTFKESKAKQVVKFQPFQNIRFQITLPDGEVVSFQIKDKQPPQAPDNLIQVNAVFSLRKL